MGLAAPMTGSLSCLTTIQPSQLGLGVNFYRHPQARPLAQRVIHRADGTVADLFHERKLVDTPA